MSMSTGPDRRAAMEADLTTGYPTRAAAEERDEERHQANKSTKLVAGQGKQAQLTSAGVRAMWLAILIIFGPPVLIGLWKLNLWLWAL